MRLFWPSRVLRAASGSAPDWSHTLHLPKSSFPARPAPAKLEEYRSRCADELYAWQCANRPAQTSDEEGRRIDNEFMLHDGPPYANGAVHVGHALNKILKDLVLRTELSQGKRVRYQPGWDCHGLPIELKALQQKTIPTKQAKSLKDSSDGEAVAAQQSPAQRDGEVRGMARELAKRTIDQQRKSFVSWAVMGEWEEPYTTMQTDFEIRQLEIFRQMVNNGLIFRAARPVYWSPSSRTALAESELEYDDQHRCTAAFVKMRLLGDGVMESMVGAMPNQPVYAVIWTTTPWTLPANKAIAVNAGAEYDAVVISNEQGEVQPGILIIGHNRLDHVAAHLPEGWIMSRTSSTVRGSDLARSVLGYNNPFSDSQGRIVTADFVSDSSGTGIVHMAPGHGMEDYQVCQEAGIGPAFAPVDDAGRYTADVAPGLIDQTKLPGLKVDADGTKTVLSILEAPGKHFANTTEQRGLVLAAHQFTHKNPIDWRTKKPVIVRSTAQWFADVSKINERALASLDSVTFVPSTGKNRLNAFIQSRSQWCISRQRAWGVPIPVLYNKFSDEENKSDEVIKHIISVISSRGSDAWFTDAPDDPAWIAPHLDPTEWVRKRDTMDVWFDSGTSWTSMKEREGQKQGDVYLEGSDQHRGWFQSSLLTKIAIADSETSPQAPFKTLITHGFTLDGNGRKMSKSIGNVISPEDIISGAYLASQPGVKKSKGKQDALGPDLLRLWVASCDYTKDVSISSSALQILQQALQKYRVTMRFLLGVLQDAKESTQPSELKLYDRIILDKLSKRSRATHRAYTEYRFFEGVRELNAFVSTDLSAFYFEITKDTMYAGLQGDRQRTQAVLTIILRELLHWLSPLTPHLVEEIWEHIPAVLKDSIIAYPLHAVWSPVAPSSELDSQQCSAATAFFEPVSKAVKAAQEKARTDSKLGSGLACAVELILPSKALQQSGFDQQQLRDALVVSELSITSKSDHSVSSAEAATSSAAWLYEEKIELVDGNMGLVRLIPPMAGKCPRCWQYTSASTGTLCFRCESAVVEQ